jgi:serine/threonine-protein kinase
VRARALHALARHNEEHATLAALEPEAREASEASVLAGLAEDFGADESDRGLRRLLASFPPETLHARFEDLAEADYSLAQWGALRYLEAVQRTDGLNLVKLYSAALASRNCGVRAKAARRLGALGNPEAVPALTRLSKQPREEGIFTSKNCGQDEAAAALQALKKKAN